MKFNFRYLKFLKTIFSKKNKFLNKSYSQCGEDRIIRYIFLLKGIKKPSYMDIGAHDPEYLSNTALFYKLGSKGINIEPNPVLYKKFLKARPTDLNINIGISERDIRLDFYIMDDSSLSTFSKIEYEKLLESGKKLNKVVNVNLSSFKSVFNKVKDFILPDFLSIDTEGMDLEIIKSIDYNSFQPKVICIESRKYSNVGKGEKIQEIFDFLESKGYHEYANTNLNSIFVLNEFWFGN